MKILTTSLLFFCFTIFVFAEGTRELAPNANITINGNNTTDIAALNLDHPDYQNFASYNNVNATSRLHIHIADPSSEGIYLGFSHGTLNASNTTNPPVVDFEYRILDPNGNVIYGPQVITTANANTQTWQSASSGPAPIYPGGYTPITVSSADLMSGGWTGSGDFYIEFRETQAQNRFLINYWDITVFDDSGASPIEKKGRLWSQNWALFAINDYDFPNRPFNGAFYVCAPDPDNPNAAFITQVDFNGSGFRPAAFNIAFNSFGAVNTGNIAMDRRSVENLNSTTPEYEIFLNDPVDLCETAEQGDVELVGISRCSANDFCIKFKTSREGQIDLLLDFDGNDEVFTPGTADVIITTNVTASQVDKFNCLDWDGRDGLGNFVGDNGQNQVPIVISYAQGIYHFPIFDAELLTDGLTINAVRPAGPQPLLYYDDSNISVSSGSGEPAVQLAGCNVPCHRWTNYTTSTTIGFGNLNTINSWWFSQQLITKAIFNIPGYYVCNIEEIEELCPGDSATLTVEFTTLPDNATAPGITDITWSGASIVGSNTGQTITINNSGTYSATAEWINDAGDTCMTTCSVEVEEQEETQIQIDTLIQRGDTVVFNGEQYYEGGKYNQKITSQEACDTLLTIIVRIQETIIHYDFDDCLSSPSDSTNMDYSEFQPDYPTPLTCADIDAGNIYREFPEVNHHSCTPGVNGSPAMCVSSLDSCDYVPGDDKSIVFEVNITPGPDTAVAINGVCFWERAPEMFDWLHGPTGPNNFPTKYGIRVLKNGTEIYRQDELPTTRDWTKETFEFKNDPNFVASEPATFRFEFLGYCLDNDSIMVAAWDMDELTVFASCISPNAALPYIGGDVVDIHDQPFTDADIRVFSKEGYIYDKTISSNENGKYLMKGNPQNVKLKLTGERVGDDLNGVSMRDAIYITQYLFGQREFNDPMEHIAADVNGSRSISVSDIIEIRKLLLGKKKNFTQPSWILGDYSAETTVSNPWKFLDERLLTLNQSSVRDIHWKAIKTGDVTFDANPSVQSELITREDHLAEMRFSDQWVEAGKRHLINLYISNFTEMQGGQLFFNLNSIDLIGIHSDVFQLNDDNHFLPKDGQLNIVWHNEYKREVAANEVLLQFDIVATKSGWVSELIEINKTGPTSEMYSGDDLTEYTIVMKSDIESPQIEETTLSVYPNPYSDRIFFELAGDTDDSARLDLFYLNGKLISSHSFTGTQLEVQSETTHSLIYKVTTSQNSFTGLLIPRK